MSRVLPLTLTFILVTLFGIWLFGCGSDSGNPTTSNTPVQPNWPQDALGLPAEDAVALDTAAARYMELLDSLTPAEARHALVDELTANGGVINWARLCPDSTTISIEFQDGVGSAIITDDILFTDSSGGLAGYPNIGSDSAEASQLRENARQAVLHIQEAITCGDIIAPESHRISLINMAGGSDSVSHWYVNRLRNDLIDLGWEPGEIRVKSRLELIDPSFTPDDMFDQQGYGIVLYLGHGGFRTASDGTEHFILQCFMGGKRSSGYEPYVTEERWQDYKRWFQTDKTLISGYSYYNGGPYGFKEVYIRDDLFAEQLNVDEGAIVSFVSCNSYHILDDMATTAAGAALGWDGQTNMLAGPVNFAKLLDFMTADTSMTDIDALATLYDSGMGTAIGSAGNTTYLTKPQRFPAIVTSRAGAPSLRRPTVSRREHTKRISRSATGTAPTTRSR